MKKSKYNFFFPMGEKVLAYNSRTNALAEVSHEDYKTIQSTLENPNCDNTNKFYQDLLYGGFLVEDYFDELVAIRHDMYTDRFSTRTLNLTIAPTADCNFRCPYCYEKEILEDKKMTDDISKKILEMIRTRIRSIETLAITWYGGEPLLEKDRIKDMSKEIISLCNENNIEYVAGIITNGYLLNSDTLLMLNECMVKTIQITLDGTAETHDQRRYLKNKGKTFDKIMKNLINISSLYENDNLDLPIISIRINVDKYNRIEAFKLLDLISNSTLSKFVIPYVAGVYDHKDIDNDYTLTVEEYNELKHEFISECMKRGYNIDYNAFYPRLVRSNCVCDQISSAVIGPEGYMYKCWEEIGDKSVCIGKVGDNTVLNLPNRYYDYMTFDPTLDEECSQCKILPVCMGSACPIRRSRDKIKNCEESMAEFEKSILKSYQLINRG